VFADDPEGVQQPRKVKKQRENQVDCYLRRFAGEKHGGGRKENGEEVKHGGTLYGLHLHFTQRHVKDW
jgi:hypothetical protein